MFTRLHLFLIAGLALPLASKANTVTGTVRGPDSTSAGLANATVILSRSTGQGGTRTPLDTVQTDAQGAYAFADVAPGTGYAVTASAAGFQTVTVTRQTVDSVAAKVVNVVLPAALPPANIAGTVRGPDSTSPGIANLTVILSKSGGGGGSRTPVDTAVTDAQGRFSFPGLPSGSNYGIDIAAPSASFRDYSNHRIDLAGVNLDLNIVMLPPPAKGMIAGTVRGPDSTSPPMAGAKVVLSKPGPTDSVRIAIDSAQTDSAGKFSFADVPGGFEYGIAVTSPTAGFRVYTNNRIDVDGDTTTLNIRLRTLGVVPRTMAAGGLKLIRQGDGLLLSLPAAAEKRMLLVCNLAGAIRYRGELTAHADRALIPGSALKETWLTLVVAGQGRSEAFRLPRL